MQKQVQNVAKYYETSKERPKAFIFAQMDKILPYLVALVLYVTVVSRELKLQMCIVILKRIARATLLEDYVREESFADVLAIWVRCYKNVSMTS